MNWQFEQGFVPLHFCFRLLHRWHAKATLLLLPGRGPSSSGTVAAQSGILTSIELVMASLQGLE